MNGTGSSDLSWISQLPIAGWICITLVCLTAFAVVLIGALRLIKTKDIAIGNFKMSEKTQLQAESRELSDNQMRGAREVLSYIQVMLREQSSKKFPGLTYLESSFLDLLFKYIMTSLLEQFRLDLVRNHIVKKTESELREYSSAKADIYYMSVQAILSRYNHEIERFNLSDLLMNIPQEEFDRLYFKAYLNAKKLSIGY